MSAVDDGRGRHRIEFVAKVGNLRPVGDDECGRRVVECGRRDVGVADFWEPLTHVFGADRIEGDDVGTTIFESFESFDDGDRPGVADVVGAGLERESKGGDALAGDVDVGIWGQLPLSWEYFYIVPT